MPEIKKLVASGLPVFGICLGHQMLGIAIGATTQKMHQGHHGANHPVKDFTTGKVEITSMNHGFAVDRETLPAEAEETHVSLFDGSNCGLRLKGKPVFSVQYHPEASPGPEDSHYLFTRFIDMIRAHKGLPAKPGRRSSVSMRKPFDAIQHFLLVSRSMNELPRQPKFAPTTQAAEGVPRLRWTLAELRATGRARTSFTEQDRIELIGGELVPMSPKGTRHEIVRSAIHATGCAEICRTNSTCMSSRARRPAGELLRADF